MGISQRNQCDEEYSRLRCARSLDLALVLAGCSSGAPAGAPPALPSTAATTAVALESPEPEVPVANVRRNTLVDQARNGDGYVDLSVDQLDKLLPQKNFTLVNVHVPYEGELPNTDLFIPFDQIQDYQTRLPAKDAPIVLYCRSGRMSALAAKTLVELGYSKVYELDGGFNGWQAAGYELLNKAQ